MLTFDGMQVPGAEWVEIVNIRNKDGSELEANNWRRNLFGRITHCWVAGGFKKRGLFFRGKIHMVDGKPAVVDIYSSTWCSASTTHPIEVEPDVYDFETKTSIYRLRILNEDEVQKVLDVIQVIIDKQLEKCNALYKAQTAAHGEGPISQ